MKAYEQSSKPFTDKAPEKFLTIGAAADLLGLHYWQLQRAVKRGLIPAHQLLTTKKLVRLSEVVASMKRSGTGEQS